MKALILRGKAGNWITCLLCVGLLVLVSLVFFPLGFETNDDNGIISITSGAFTGSPYAGNGYTSYAYGALLVMLYSLWGGVPWHTLLQLLIVFFSLAVILKSILLTCRRYAVSSGFGIGVFLALYAGVFLQYTVKLQYTTTAAFAATAGLCLVWMLEAETAGWRKAVSIFGAMILLSFSLGLRKESFWACMPLLAGFCVLRCIECRRLNALWRCLMVLGGALLFMAVDLQLYRAHEPNWDAFRVFYDLRCELLDYNNTDLMEQTALQALGWPGSMVRMLRNWYMLDDHMNIESLRALLEAVAQVKPKPTFLQLLKSVASILRRYPIFAFNFMAAGFWGSWSVVRQIKAKKYISIGYIAGTAIYLILFVGYFYGMRERLPERAAFAAACPCYVFFAFACIRQWQTRESGHPARQGLAICLAVMLLAGGGTLAAKGTGGFRWNASPQPARQVSSEILRDYALAHPSLLYVTDVPQIYGALYTDPMDAPNLLSWGHPMYGSDVVRIKEQGNGFDGVDTAALFHDRVRLILSDANMRMLLEYLESLYESFEMQQEDQVAGFSVYKLIRLP